MSKSNGKPEAAERMLGDIAAAYAKLPRKEQEARLSKGDALIASRKAFLAKRRQPAAGPAKTRRIRAAR